MHAFKGTTTYHAQLHGNCEHSMYQADLIYHGTWSSRCYTRAYTDIRGYGFMLILPYMLL